MKRKLLALVVCALCLAAPAIAQAGGTGFDLSWATVDGGGGTVSSGGAYTLGGTAGQPDAGTASGGAFTLMGGFWSGGGTTLGPAK